MNKWLLSGLLLCASSAFAQQAPPERGMYLCVNIISAHDLWYGAADAQRLGVKVTKEVFDQIAKKQMTNGGPACRWVSSKTDLKPIAADDKGYMVLTDGKTKGWATAQYYVAYMNAK